MWTPKASFSPGSRSPGGRGRGCLGFELRPGVTFSNGEPFDAEAVVATIAYLTSEAAKAESVAQEIRSVASARALGPLTVLRSRTKTPDPILPRTLATMRIVAPRPGWNAAATVSPAIRSATGPFMLAVPATFSRTA